MKFKLALSIVTIISMFLLGFIIYKVHILNIPQKRLLDIAFTDINNKTFNADSLKRKASLIFFVSPDCKNCVSEVNFITQNINLLSQKYNVIILLESEEDEALQFMQEHQQLNHQNDVTIGIDKIYRYADLYSIKSFPVCIVFNASKKQLNRITVPINSLNEIESILR